MSIHDDNMLGAATSKLQDLRQQLTTANAELADQYSQAKYHLSVCVPSVEPLDNVSGILSQFNNAIAGMNAELERLREKLAAARRVIVWLWQNRKIGSEIPVGAVAVVRASIAQDIAASTAEGGSDDN